ncbi:alanine:cation symporter family protein [bacterium]|nr:alanine:cation symporter family protein [bacterium]
MKRLLLLLMILLLKNQSCFAFNIDATLDKYIAPISDRIANLVFYPIPICGTEVPIIIFWILFAGLFFTIYLRGIAIWGFKHSIDILRKPNSNSDDKNGEVSSFQALATALSGTIGLGSIAGVAIAISLGGPGAAFWILVGAILGMSLKFVEASLAVKYRRFNLDGSISGGPMHYMAHGLTRKKLRWLGQPLSVFFAVLCICGGLTGGNMIQINQTAQQFVDITGGQNSFFYGQNWIIGLTVAIVVGLIVVGGIKSIAKVTEKIVPFMCAIYIISGLIVIVANFTLIPHAIMVILKQAFFPEAVAGGIFGTIIMGLRRSVQSNEAGTGSAPIAYATVKTNEPVSQGFVSLIEPFLTGLLCMLTAFVITITNTYHSGAGISGVQMTSEAFSTVLPIFPYILAVVVILFALSTIISWAYYGQKAWNFMFGEGRKRTLTFQFIYCSFIIIGSVMNLSSVINITDAMMISMSIPNIITMYILAPEIKRDLLAYAKSKNLAASFNKNWYKKASL